MMDVIQYDVKRPILFDPHSTGTQRRKSGRWFRGVGWRKLDGKMMV